MCGLASIESTSFGLNPKPLSINSEFKVGFRAVQSCPCLESDEKNVVLVSVIRNEAESLVEGRFPCLLGVG